MIDTRTAHFKVIVAVVVGFTEDRMMDIITGRAPPPARAESIGSDLRSVEIVETTRCCEPWPSRTELSVRTHAQPPVSRAREIFWGHVEREGAERERAREREGRGWGWV